MIQHRTLVLPLQGPICDMQALYMRFAICRPYICDLRYAGLIYAICDMQALYMRFAICRPYCQCTVKHEIFAAIKFSIFFYFGLFAGSRPSGGKQVCGMINLCFLADRETLVVHVIISEFYISLSSYDSFGYVTGHIKDPVPLIKKRRGLSPGGRFPPSFIHQVIIITGLNKLYSRMFSS